MHYDYSYFINDYGTYKGGYVDRYNFSIGDNQNREDHYTFNIVITDNNPEVVVGPFGSSAPEEKEGDL